MNSWYFWKNWHPQSKTIYWFLLAVFAALLLYFAYIFFESPSTVIEWQKISNVDKVQVPGDSFRIGLFDFSYDFDNYVVTENYRGSSIEVSKFYVLFQLFMLCLSLIFLLVIVSSLQGFWFYFGAIIMSGVMISFKFEQLMLFGNSNKLGLISALAIYLPSLYYFSSIRPDHDLLRRIGAFSLITLLFGTFLFITADVAYPYVYLVNYGLVAPLILSIVFIFVVGHVMISFFVKIITMGNTVGSKNSMWHFLAISLIYLFNVGLLYAKNAGYLQWDIIYLNAYFILVVVTILGIWEFKDREYQYVGLMPFAPLGALLYISLAIICFSTIGYIFAIANDPLLESMEDTIVFSQLAYGTLFMLYIVFNFIQPLMDNLQVYKFMYRPPNFPYGSVQITSLIAITALLLNSNMLPFKQAVSGYYNGIADLYLLKDDVFVGEQYYKLGDQYGYNNHRSNYALGTLARDQGDQFLAPFYFSESIKKKPTAFAQVNLGNALLEKDQYFDALYTYRQGLRKFEANPYLYNNLAITYGKTSLLDSALYFLSLAAESPLTKQAAETNMLGLIGREENLFSFALDSLLDEVLEDRAYVPSLVNAFLLANKYGRTEQALQGEDFRWLSPEDSALNAYQFAYLYNYTFNRPEQLESTQLQALQAFSVYGANANLYEPLSVIRSWALYHNWQVVEAMKILDGLQAMNPFQRGYYNHMLGMWALQQNSPQVSVRFLEMAERARYEQSLFHKAVALSEAYTQDKQLKQEAMTAWDSLYTLESEGIAEVNPLVQQMRQILTVLPADLSELQDEFLYLLFRYRFHDLDQQQRQAILREMDNLDFVAIALHDNYLLYQNGQELLRPLIKDMLPPADSLSEQASVYRSWAEIFLLEDAEQWDDIINSTANLAVPGIRHEQLLEYYAIRHMMTEEREAEINEKALKLIGNPLFEKGFLLALDVLFEDSLEKYNLLLDAQQTNPFSISLKKALIRASLQAGLESYAEDALTELREMLTEREYTAYLKLYEEMKLAYTPSF